MLDGARSRDGGGAPHAAEGPAPVRRHSPTRRGGLATDYCVKETALGATRLGYDVSVLTEGIRAVDLEPGDGERVLEETRSAGARVLEAPDGGHPSRRETRSAAGLPARSGRDRGGACRSFLHRYLRPRPTAVREASRPGGCSVAYQAGRIPDAREPKFRQPLRRLARVTRIHADLRQSQGWGSPVRGTVTSQVGLPSFPSFSRQRTKSAG